MRITLCGHPGALFSNMFSFATAPTTPSPFQHLLLAEPSGSKKKEAASAAVESSVGSGIREQLDVPTCCSFICWAHFSTCALHYLLKSTSLLFILFSYCHIYSYIKSFC